VANTYTIDLNAELVTEFGILIWGYAIWKKNQKEIGLQKAFKLLANTTAWNILLSLLKEMFITHQ